MYAPEQFRLFNSRTARERAQRNIRCSMALKLSMTCGPYDRARALIQGSVKPEGIDLVISVNDDDVDRQQRSARGEFDVCEFFTGTYIADLPFKKLGFTAIPIFVKRMFRHSYIYINKNSGIRDRRPQRQARRRADVDHQRGAVGEGHAGGRSRRRPRIDRMGGMAVGAHPRLEGAGLAQACARTGGQRSIRPVGAGRDRCRHHDRDLGAEPASRYRFPVSGSWRAGARILPAHPLLSDHARC